MRQLADKRTARPVSKSSGPGARVAGRVQSGARSHRRTSFSCKQTLEITVASGKNICAGQAGCWAEEVVLNIEVGMRGCYTTASMHEVRLVWKGLTLQEVSRHSSTEERK